MLYSKRGAAVAAVCLAALCGVFAPVHVEAKKKGAKAQKKFLEDKAKEKDVVKLPSGLLYKVLKSGDGKNHPTVDSPCACHYEGKLIDGTKFDSSYDRGEPTTFAPNQVIKGWTEAMQLMVEGDKWEMYIPYDLAYGERGMPPTIPAKATLVFTMEIVTIKGKKVPKVEKKVEKEEEKEPKDEL